MALRPSPKGNRFDKIEEQIQERVTSPLAPSRLSGSSTQSESLAMPQSSSMVSASGQTVESFMLNVSGLNGRDWLMALDVEENEYSMSINKNGMFKLS